MERHASRRIWTGLAAIVLLGLGSLRADDGLPQDFTPQISKSEHWTITVTCNCSFDVTATEISGTKKTQRANYQLYQHYRKTFIEVDKNRPVKVNHVYDADQVTNLASGNPTPTALQGAEVNITEASPTEAAEVEVVKGTLPPSILNRLRATEECFLLTPPQPKKRGDHWALDAAHALALDLQGEAVAGTGAGTAEAEFSGMDESKPDIAIINLTLSGKQLRNDPDEKATLTFKGEYRFNVKTHKPVSLRLTGNYKADARVGETPVTVDGTAAPFDLTVKYETNPD